MVDNDQTLTLGLNGTNTKQSSGFIIWFQIQGFCVKVVSVSQWLFHWNRRTQLEFHCPHAQHIIWLLRTQCEGFFPSMLTQSAMPQGWLSNTITHTPTLMHLTVMWQWCRDGFRGAFTINLTVELPYFLHTDSYTVSHVYEIMSHDTEFFLSLYYIWYHMLLPGWCYSLGCTPGLPLTQLSSGKISFWEPLPAKGRERVLRGYRTTKCSGIERWFTSDQKWSALKIK